MDLDVARGSSGEGDGAIVAGSGGKPRVKPPSQVRCPNCGHWKHPRSLSCKEPGCGCSCAKHQQGIRKKRQFAQIASSDGQWDGTVQRRLVHQVTLLPDSTHRPRLPTKQQRRIPPRPSPSTHPRSPSRAQIKFASELMAKSGVVYGLWTAYKDRDGKVSKVEFRKAVAALGYDVPKKSLNQVFDDMDESGDGMIEYGEFKSVLRNTSKVRAITVEDRPPSPKAAPQPKPKSLACRF